MQEFISYYYVIVNSEVNCKGSVPEKKLSVEVGNVNGVHVNHMDKAKPG